MPVTTRAAPVAVKPAPLLGTFNSTSLLQASCPSLWEAGSTILDSSFGPDTFIQPSRNGFVSTVLDAYLQHNHLVLRPEDLWFAILIQFSFYVNQHSEELRKYFVDHAGKKKLQILQEIMDLPAFVLEMTELITQNVKDPSLREWIMPSFSTTTDSDKISAAIIMMGTMQKYFAYFLGITCGIPSVTLLGEKKDWEDILERIQFLGTFGPDHEELLIWNSVLTGVVSNFVRTFDAPDSPEVVKFWQRTVHQFADDYSGEKLITGWLLAFCFWDADGKPLVVENIGRITRNWTQSVQEHGSEYWLDGIRLGQLEWNDVPAGYAHVPIHIRGGDGEKYMAKAIAGSVGWRVLNSDSVFSGTRAIKKKSDKSQSNVLAFLTGDSESSSSSTFTSDSTLVERPSSKPGAFQRIVQKLLCFNSKNDDPIRTGDETSIQKAEATNPPHLHAQNPSNDYTPDHSNNWFEKSMRKNAPQISTLNELKKPWEYEKGGKNDTLQPVTGWWVVTTSKREYGKDPDCPDVTFDSDDEEYDPDVMGRHGEKLRREDDIWTRNDISLEYRDALPPVLREEIEKKLKEDEEEEKRQKLNKQRD